MVAITDRPLPATTRSAPADVSTPSSSLPLDVAPLIVGFDGSTPATAALAWAASTGLPVILVRVIERRPPRADRPDLDVSDASLVLGDHARAAAPRLAKCAWRAELVVSFSPASALAAFARRHGATAIVVGSHGHSYGRTVLGREPHQLLAEADVPVVVIPPQAAARLLRSPST
jgi:nucleotide-binding universal stress UspA family protein